MNNDEDNNSLKTIDHTYPYSIFDERNRSKAQQIIFEEHVKNVIDVFSKMCDEQEKW